MDSFIILAQAAETAGETTQGKVVPVDLIWQQITSLGLLEALTFISFGAVCLFYGWRVFKILVIISFALIGLFVGVYTNRTLIGGNGVWLGIIAMVLFGFFSVPMMRWGVSILGAAAGGMLTGGAWYALRLPEQYIWAGALVGAIAGGELVGMANILGQATGTILIDLTISVISITGILFCHVVRRAVNGNRD